MRLKICKKHTFILLRSTSTETEKEIKNKIYKQINFYLKNGIKNSSPSLDCNFIK